MAGMAGMAAMAGISTKLAMALMPMTANHGSGGPVDRMSKRL
jgi:hypothetical protein